MQPKPRPSLRSILSGFHRRYRCTCIMKLPASPAHSRRSPQVFAGRRIMSRRSMRFLRATLTFCALCALAPSAGAQDSYDAPPPHVAIVEGTVTLDREDVTEPATGGVPMVPGDRLRTERGRAELLFPDGSALDLDEDTVIEVEGPTLLRMTSGRVILFAAGSSNAATALQFQIDTPVASAQTDAPGEYRVTMLGDPSGPQTEMAIVRGSGALVTEVGTMPLRSGERSVAWDNAAPSRPQIFNSARYDAFDQWAMALRDQRLGSRSQSAQYLPADLRMYGGELDRYGAWGYEEPYGNVWYPTVAAEWRPYYDGYWSSVPNYGWTWIGVDAWSWPTHHYGRWGYGRNRWFWIPDRRWAPAWVSWGGAPGYVSWCPLGFDNRPVFSLSVSIGNSYRGWNGWTVVSRDHFGGRRYVNQFAVSPRSLPRNVGFVAQASAPVAPPRAVSRRGNGNGGAFAGDRRQFPNVVGRAADGRASSAVSRRGVNGDRPAAGQLTQGGRPNSVTRTPQGVSRQPQTFGQSQRSEAGRFGDRPQAVSRQPQVPSAQTPQNGDRPSYDGQNRGASRVRPPDARATNPANSTNPFENRSSSARSRYERPSVPQAPAQPITPGVPQRSERPQYGTATRRAESIRPVAPAQPESSQPGFSRRSGGPIYTQRPSAPPPVTAPPQQPQRQERSMAPPRQERQMASPRQEQPAAPPRQERQVAPPRQERQQAPQREERAPQPRQERQERQSDQGRSRGHENQQQSDGQQNGGGGGGHARRR
jgi:Family of unknown function (DUF6600)/FecR protein